MDNTKNVILESSSPNNLTSDCIIHVSLEKVPGKGEDSFYYNVNEKTCLVGVFDGCGGSGAQRYERFQGHSGAYMASRAAAGATKDWYPEQPDSTPPDIKSLKKKIIDYLTICNDVGGVQSKLKGLMTKDFPTTAAITMCKHLEKKVEVDCVWAGDSRCYYLSEDGLMQLTEDDLGGIEAMDNLTADGVLTNCISLSDKFDLHLKSLSVQKPGVLFSATDGCFGYLSTPMEFEYLLEKSLAEADSVEMWEKSLLTKFQSISGDDATLCGIVFGCHSFAEFQNRMTKRTAFVYEHFVREIESMSVKEKTELWVEYKEAYNQFL